MQKIIEIDGNKVKFVSHGATPIIYKKITSGRDFFADLFRMSSMTEIMSGKSKKINVDKIESMDFDIFYNIIYCLRYCANKDIPPLEEWLAEFDSFPVIEIIGQLNELLISSIQSKKK